MGDIYQCADCGVHLQTTPRGDIQTGACPDCGGQRLFRMQPNPVQSEGTLRNMVDMETGKDAGGNPDGEGILAPPSGRAILTAFIGDIKTCNHCGWNSREQGPQCPKCHWPFEADESSGIPAELRPQIAGDPLTEGSIFKDGDDTQPYDTGAHGRDEYTHGHVLAAVIEGPINVLQHRCPRCQGDLLEFLDGHTVCDNCGATAPSMHQNIPSVQVHHQQGYPETHAFDAPKQPNFLQRMFATNDEEGYNGWPNWDTWHTKLLMDNDEGIYNMQKQMAREGWTPEQIRDWAIENVVGPHNRERIQDAKEWNEIPEAERLDPHYEEFAKGNPKAAELVDALGFGRNVKDIEPEHMMLMDPEMIDWHGIHHHINDDYEENQRYENGEPPSWQDPKPDPNLDKPGKDTFPSEWVSKTADAWTGHDPLDHLRCPDCHLEVVPDRSRRELFCSGCERSWPVRGEMPVLQEFHPQDTIHDLYEVPDVQTGLWTQQIPKHWGKVAGEMEDIVGIGNEPARTNLNWTPGMKGRGIVIGGEPHTWNSFDPNKDWKAGDVGLFHPQYVESLGVSPEHVDWNTGVEIEPDGRVIAVGGHNVAPFIEADPRLKHVEDNFFSFSRSMPKISRTNNMEPYLPWTHEADVQFDKGPLKNTPSYSAVVQPNSESGIHGAHTGRRGILSFLDAHINGIPVRGHGGDLVARYGFRSSPDFGKPVVVAVHDPSHLPIAIESIQDPIGKSMAINNLVSKIQSGEVPPPPGINAQTLEPLPGAFPSHTAGFWGDLLQGAEVAAPAAAGVALAPETGGASLGLDAAALGEAGAGADAAAGTAGGLMSKALSGAGGLAKAEGISNLVNQGVGMGEGMLGIGQGQSPSGAGAGYAGPLQQFTHVLAAFVEGDLHLPKGHSTIPSYTCPACHVPSAMNEYGECQNCNYTIPYDGGEWEDMPLADRLLDQAYQETGDGYNWKNPSLMPSLGPIHQGRIADYETPASNPDVGVKHDDPEDVDQKEFNDQDKSPENPKNPNLQDSGASGEDESRKDGDKPSQGQFSPDSPGIQRMEMLMPLIEKYYHSDESGANDPMLKGLHEMLEAENPGYLTRADEQAAERFMQNKKQPGHVHATIHESIMPPMQQGNLNAQQQALDPTGLNPSLQAPSSQTPPGGGMQQGHCPKCGGVTQPDGSCPQCGAPAQGATPQLPGGPSVAPNPQTFAHMDLLASLVDSANHQGPVTPEQIAAVQQFLIQEGRVDEVPNVPLDPGNPEYAKILNEIQNNPMTPPTVTPEEQTQPPPPQPQAPGGMPVPGMAPGEAGGQPMQPISSFLPELHFAADNIAPRCPECGSATTGLVGDQDHHAKCHACHNVWKLNDILSDENYGQTSIAKTAIHEDHQHGEQAHDANPIGVPAAEQDQRTDQGGDEDSSLTWKDSEGTPLKAGETYQMINPSYALPDLVRVERVKPDGIDITLLGTYANDPVQHDPNTLTSSTQLSKQDMEMQNISFEPVAQNADEQNNEPPPGSQAPGHEQVPPSGQTTDEQTASEPAMYQSSVNDDCPRCGHREFTSSMITPEATEHSCFRCGHDWVTEEKDTEHQAGMDLSWVMEDENAEDLSPRHSAMARASVQSRNIGDIAEKDERLRAVRDHLMQEKEARLQRISGRHFTPKEQRELIDEDGIARNHDMLDLEGTHYKSSKEQEKANSENAPDEHMFLGLY